MPGRDEILAGLPGRIDVMNTPIDPWNMAQTVEATDKLVSAGSFAHLMGVNADKLLQMRDDPWMDSCVRGCEIVNADGASMVMAAERLGNPLPCRVAGIDLMRELCDLAERRGYPVYLLGAKPEVVSKTAEVLGSEFPGMKLAGIHDGYFSESEWDAVAENVRETGSVITFVGITSPKKELLIEHFRELGLTGAFVGVGGSFDVVSGNIPRAPMWMQKMNLEWAFRMAQEPGRLVKRYLIGNTRFLKMLRAEERKLNKENRRA